MRLFLAALLLTTTLSAQTTPQSPKEKLTFTLILSRHGIRPPLTANTDLNQRSADPWPDWEVKLGYLTPHGELALQSMGTYLREDLVHAALLPAKGCPDPSSIYLYSDIDERNIESTRNTFLTFAPNCPTPPIHISATPPDPIFSGKGLPDPPADKVAAARASLGADFDTAAANPELTELAHILAPHRTHPAARPILDDPHPLAVSASLIEDLYLEYIDKKPLPEVGWGRLDPAALNRLLPLHAKAFGSVYRDPYMASYVASDLASHILDTLQQAATNTATPGAIGPTTARLVYLSGHDTNLHSLADLLHLSWTIEGVTNDTPPDSQIIFELWQSPHTHATSVRIRIRQQTTAQLRSADPLTPAHPPFETYVTPLGCTAAKFCPFAIFAAAIQPLLNPATTLPLQPLKLAPTE